jgi:hypothetical protein
MPKRIHHLRDINDPQEVYSILADIMGQETAPSPEPITALVGLVIFNELRELNTTLRRIEDGLDRDREDPDHDNKPKR